MSQYFNIKGLKVRVSDHEPNFSMDKLRGRNDIELYTQDITGKKLDLQSQIEKVLDSQLAADHGLTMADFNQVLGKKERSSVMLEQYKVIDSWFANPEENAELLADVKKNPRAYASYRLTKKQVELFVNYVNSKF
ncbi:MAG: hypothetical protein C0424_10265 [Sphingobacteriaceae bacterium]|nr:hypothetical protein [Sphingobacteriaceae bacterium]